MPDATVSITGFLPCCCDGPFTIYAANTQFPDITATGTPCGLTGPVTVSINPLGLELRCNGSKVCGPAPTWFIEEVGDPGSGDITGSVYSPEGVHSAPVGTVYIGTGWDAYNPSCFYKETGTGNTGWVDITTGFGNQTLVTSANCLSYDSLAWASTPFSIADNSDPDTVLTLTSVYAGGIGDWGTYLRVKATWRGETYVALVLIRLHASVT